MKHDYHFVLPELTLNKLETLKSKKFSFNNISDKLNKLINAYLFKFKSYTKIQNKKSKYLFVDLENPPIDKHVYLDEANYKGLKQIHADFNYDSIAQIMREVILLFLNNTYLLDLIMDEELVLKRIKKNPLELSSSYHHLVVYDVSFNPITVKLRE